MDPQTRTPLDQLATADWGKAPDSVVKPVMMARGTLLSLDMAKTRLLCEEVLGFACIEIAPDRMLLRHRTDRSGAPYWVLEVRAAPSNPTPQKMSNHWGIWVPEVADVDAAYALLSANMETYGIAKVHKPRYAHEGRRDYSMYFEDISGNWWEIDRHPIEDEFIKFFNSGDWDSRPAADADKK
jgi:hypothetical protein